MDAVCQPPSKPMELFAAPKIVKTTKPKRKTDNQLAKDKLPSDPRQWTREEVHQWLRVIASAHNLPEVKSSRFAMNGKALCLMTPAMFVQRVPLGGKLLYRDFQLRLTIAVHSARNQR